MIKEYLDPITEKTFVAKFVKTNGSLGIFVPIWVKSEPEQWIPVETTPEIKNREEVKNNNG